MAFQHQQTNLQGNYLIGFSIIGLLNCLFSIFKMSRASADDMLGSKSFNDDDDEIVEERDVYVVDNLNLCLLQYPLKPVFGDCEFTMKSVKYKPNNSKLEYDVPNPTSFSKSTDFDDDDDFGDGQRAKSQLIAASVVPSSNLGVCILKDGAVHINPIKAVYQMRPSFRNLRGKGEIVETVVAPVEVKEDRPIVQLKRREGEKPNTMRSLTYTQVQIREESEAWMNLKFNGLESASSRSDLEKMVAK